VEVYKQAPNRQKVFPPPFVWFGFLHISSQFLATTNIMSPRKRSRQSDDGDCPKDVNSLLNNVYEALEHEASKGVFAVGGEIEFQPDSGPVTIRWDSSNLEQGSKVSLPIKDDDESAFQQLLKDCQPATFGLGGEEVLDEEYRKAGKMDTTNFSSTFNLAQDRIMYTLHQALVQSPLLDKMNKRLRGVRAELYKLNVRLRHRETGC
jgi:hypothetical protein